MKMKWLGRLLLISLLTSCSAQWHLKKAVQKDPLILERDTLVVTDTVVTQPVAITDTVTLKQQDTITLVKEKLKVRLVRVNDTITINAECASDTIVKTIEVPYEKVVYIKEKTLFEKLQGYTLIIVVLALIATLAMRYISND